MYTGHQVFKIHARIIKIKFGCAFKTVNVKSNLVKLKSNLSQDLTLSHQFNLN